MLYLIIGLIIFLGAHLFTIFSDARRRLIRRIGLNPYRVVYSMIALIGMALIIYGFGIYRASEYTQIWNPPLLLRHLALILNIPVFILVAANFLPGRIQQTFKYPLLVAIKLWATAHLLANGDLGAIVLFGGILAWAVILRIAAKRQEAAEGPPYRSGPLRNDLLAVIIGLVIYLMFLDWLHLMLIGIPIVSFPILTVS